MFGNAISEEQRQNSLFQSLGIAGAGALSTRYAANMGQAVVTKGTEKLTQMRNTLRTSAVANVTKQAYQSVKTAPASWTQSLHKTYTSILDSTMPRLMPKRAPAGPAFAQQTVRETLQNVKQQAMQMITPLYNPKVKRYQDPGTGRFVANPNVERVEKPVGVEKKGKEVEPVRNVESVQDVSKGMGETIQVKNIKNEVDIIAERAKGLDLTLRETPYKIMGSKKMKQLNEKVKNRTITKEEWKQLMWNKRFKRRRDNGVDDFWEQERERLLNGEATRIWTEKQAKDIINGKAPKYEGKTMIGHHTYSASKYPQIANKGEIIYPVTFREHLYRWHGGSYKKSLPGKPLNDSVDNDF
ncbi:hypothetical protein [Priestia flexa]|uniref:Tox-GHH domain-containing protein n=1 Tax=Priestia flexa TaxID=86664 RepID=A0ABU4J7B9_9BACI|nr:hypothetical protein [Priestia flexa]MDW8516910.1 hypothetical protein [Priestia flexa]